MILQSLREPTLVLFLPEELLAVIGRVRLLHLGVAVPRDFTAQRWREEGGAIPLGGRRGAEGSHLGGGHAQV